MSQTNQYQPPASLTADIGDNQEIDIDSLDVSDKWKTRFKWLRRAGGPSMLNAKHMTRQERRGFINFNILAFLFGPFYYLAKGMWRKAISLFVVCAAGAIVLESLLDALGFGEFGKAVGYGVGAVFAVRANIDYYKKMVLEDNGWW